MADPKINEQYLLSVLDVPCSLDVIDRLQSGALMSSVNGFDRRILRDPFMALTAAAFSLHTNLGRFHLLARIRELEKEQKLTTEKLDEANLQLQAFCETERVHLVSQVTAIAACPTSVDKVN
jgi:hypothetical protein